MLGAETVKMEELLMTWEILGYILTAKDQLLRELHYIKAAFKGSVAYVLAIIISG